MRICRLCSAPIYHVMNLSKEKRDKFDNTCRKCQGNRKNQSVEDSEVDFNKELYKAIQRRKNGEEK